MESPFLCRFNFRSHLYIRERREKLLGKWVAFVVAVVGHIAAEEMVMEVKRILPKVHPTVMLILRHRLLIRLLGTFQPQSTLNSQGDILEEKATMYVKQLEEYRRVLQKGILPSARNLYIRWYP